LLIDSRQTVPMMSGLVALTAMSSVGGLGIEEADLGNVVDAAASMLDMPMGISMGTPVFGDECVGGACMPAPGQSPPVYEVMPPQFAPDGSPYAATPQSKPGPWTGGPAPVIPAPWVPHGTPVPYYVPSAVGQPYVPPSATPPNVPANYQTPTQPPVGVPAPAKMRLATPAGFPPQATTSAPPANYAPNAPITSNPCRSFLRACRHFASAFLGPAILVGRLTSPLSPSVLR
jgi:hypothetical protein